MSDKLGIVQTSEAISASIHLAKKIIQIRKMGVAGLPLLAELYGDVKKGIEGGDQIPAEMKDIDVDEAKALFKLTLVETGGLLQELGAKNYEPYALIMADSLEAGETTYAAWKPVIEKIQALRNAPKE